MIYGRIINVGKQKLLVKIKYISKRIKYFVVRFARFLQITLNTSSRSKKT